MKILVTSGPTREPIDPVRFISNRSSGKMGHAIARVAVGRGHQVVLVSGPVCLKTPKHVRRIPVTTALEMMRAVHLHIKSCDALVMAAAVSDWRPKTVSSRKLKKGRAPDVVKLVRNPDILQSVKALKGRRIHVGFAAETENEMSEGRRKLKEKGLDLIVVNDVSRSDSGFDVDTNRVTLLEAGGTAFELPLMKKAAVAARIIKWIEKMRAGAAK